MHILKVCLENIKNFKDEIFTFEPGTNAICGPNGAGKTTIIEAISFALFDSIPYKKEDFVRRGEKKGTVRITFVSSLDSRVYTVVRATGVEHFVYDEELNVRVAEQTSQVLKWLHEHMEVETSLSLSELFETTIGVQQGMFTADFKLTAGKRKPIFDKMLRVEEYRIASDELKYLGDHIKARLQVLQNQMAEMDGELKQLPELTVELTRLAAELQRLESALSQSERLQAEADTALKILDSQAEALNRLTGLTQTRQLQCAHAEKDCQAALQELERARTAHRLVQETLEDFQAYQKNTVLLEDLSKQRKMRDELKDQLNRYEHDLNRVRVEYKVLQEELSGAEAAREQLKTLKPMADKQAKLENSLQQLEVSLGAYLQLEKSRKSLNIELEKLRARCLELTRRAEEFEKFRPLAESLAGLEEQLQTLQQEERRLHTRAIEQQQWRQHQDRLAVELNTLVKNMEQLTVEINQVEKLKPIADDYGSLTQQHKNLQAQAADLKARVKNDQITRTQVKDGLCPFLRQSCKNLTPGQTLVDFFDTEIADYSRQIQEAEEGFASVDAKLNMAKSAQIHLENLPRLNEQLGEMAARQDTLQNQDIDLTRCLAEFPPVDETHLTALRQKIAQLNQAQKDAGLAKSKIDKLHDIAEQMTQSQADIQTRTAQLTHLNDQLDALDKTRVEKDTILAELKLLGDSHIRCTQLMLTAAKETEIQKRLEALHIKGKTLRAEVDGFNERLKIYTQLDEQWQTTQSAQRRLENAHNQYLKNEALAKILPEAQQHYDQAERQFAQATRELAEHEMQMRQAAAGYDANRHQELRNMMQQRRDQIAAFRENIRTARQLQTTHEQKQKQLTEIVERRASLAKDVDRLQRMMHFVDYSRDLLKEAGPQVSAVSQINVTSRADQLFRNISGRPYLTLTWTPTYDIEVQEDGRSRTFNNLSGGEQMSAALAVRLALLKEVSKVDVAFFDEPTVNMDEIRRRNLADQIRQIPGFSQLFVISHDDTFERVTDHVVRVGRDDNGNGNGNGHHAQPVLVEQQADFHLL